MVEASGSPTLGHLARQVVHPLGGAMTAATRPPRFDVMGVEFDAVTEEAVVDRVMAALRAGRGGWIVTPNVDILRQIRRNAQFGAMVRRASLVVVDGAPVQWAGRIAGHGEVQRAPGSNVVGPLIRRAAAEGRPVLLLGGRPGASARAAQLLRAEIPNLRVLEHCPPYGFEGDEGAWSELVAAVRDAEAGVVLCGFGFPKQERLMATMSVLHPQTWFIGVGATIDFLAGEVRRAPAWVQRIGFEWIFRLAMEPRRLARRYLVDGLPFAARMLGWALARRVRPLALGSGASVHPVDLERPALGGSPREYGATGQLGAGSSQPYDAAESDADEASIPMLGALCGPDSAEQVRARALDDLVERIRRQGRYADCVGLLQERLTLPFDDPGRKLIAQMQLSRFLMESGALLAAIDTATEALADADRAGLGASLEGVKLRVTLADLLCTRGDLKTADLHIGLALRAAQRHGDPIMLGVAQWNGALVSSGQGRHEEARDLARAAGRTLAEAGNRLAAALVGLVEVSVVLDSRTQNLAGVEDLATGSLAVIREQGSPAQQGVAVTQVARIHLRRGDANRALEDIRRAQSLLDLGNVVDRAVAQSVEAQALAALGEHQSALSLASLAAEQLHEAGALLYEARVWTDLAAVSPEMSDAGAGRAAAPAIPAPRRRLTLRRRAVDGGPALASGKPAERRPSKLPALSALDRMDGGGAR